MKIRNWKGKLSTAGLFLGILAIYFVFRLPCPFQFILHIPCLGCGMTRAYLSLLRLDILGAFQMHGMFWSVPILGLYYLYDWQLFKKTWLDNTVLILLLLGFVANWVVHIILRFI